MCQFLLSNKKYKYEEFFIDEYKELDEYMIFEDEGNIDEYPYAL